MNDIVWSIAGSDGSGGAGIQADLKTFQALGVYGCSVITAIPAQNHQEINQIHYLPPENVAAQINALAKVLPPRAIKIGMLGEALILKTVADFLRDYQGYVVLDPILNSSSGFALFNGDLEDYVNRLKKLFMHVDMLTPNQMEAEMLSGVKIKNYIHVTEAANEILKLGAKSILIKGAHFPDQLFSQDYWTNGSESFWLTSLRQQHQNYRGTGCTLSSALAAYGSQYELKESLILAKKFMNQCIRGAKNYQTNSPMRNPDAYLNYDLVQESAADLPYVSKEPLSALPKNCLDCGENPIGIYPIVSNSSWLEKLIPSGITTIQLRIKNQPDNVIREEIQKSISLAKQHSIRLFINDYWQYAIQYGAYGVHLGQEDLMQANVAAIRQAGLRLGISTHNYFELARAQTQHPSYIASGPVFKTQTKILTTTPLGVKKLQAFKQVINFPMVAIGGIKLSNVETIKSVQPSGIAMISEIMESDDPVSVVKSFQKKLLMS